MVSSLPGYSRSQSDSELEFEAGLIELELELELETELEPEVELELEFEPELELVLELAVYCEVEYINVRPVQSPMEDTLNCSKNKLISSESLKSPAQLKPSLKNKRKKVLLYLSFSEFIISRYLSLSHIISYYTYYHH